MLQVQGTRGGENLEVITLDYRVMLWVKYNLESWPWVNAMKFWWWWWWWWLWWWWWWFSTDSIQGHQIIVQLGTYARLNGLFACPVLCGFLFVHSLKPMLCINYKWLVLNHQDYRWKVIFFKLSLLLLLSFLIALTQGWSIICYISFY